MQKYGLSLKKLLKKSKHKRFSIKSAIQIGIQLCDRLEVLHNHGYLHADLKPDNVLIASTNRLRVESSQMILIDFGIAKSWKDTFGRHIPFRERVPFSGNLLFASKNAFRQVEQSRRDDLISLVYLVIFFVQGELGWMKNLKSTDPLFFQKVAKIKQNLNSKTLCTGPAKGLEAFCDEVFSYEFEDTPNYSKIKHMLACFLLVHNVQPDNVFDWSKFSAPNTDLQNHIEGQENVDEKEVPEVPALTD